MLMQSRGQSSVEYIFAMALMLIILAISTFVYVSNSEEAGKLRDAMEANRLCVHVASSISAVASAPGNANRTLSLPPYLYGKNYTVYVSSPSSVVKVDYSTYGTGCSLLKMNVTNSTGAGLFEVKKNAVIASNGGRIIVNP